MKLFATAVVTLVILTAPVASSEAVRVDDTSIQVIMSDEGLSRVFFPKSGHTATVDGADYTFAYVHAVRGQPYSIRVNNYSRGHKLACIAVDGRNVIDGEKVTNPQQRSSWGKCYLVTQSATIEGWRTSSQSVRRFVFTDESRSVANTQWNDTSATGTMVVATFREQEQLLSDRQIIGRSRGLGTGAGESVHSKVERVEFKSQPTATAVIVINYASKQALVDAGLWPSCQDQAEFKRFAFRRCSEEGYIKFK